MSTAFFLWFAYLGMLLPLIFAKTQFALVAYIGAVTALAISTLFFLLNNETRDLVVKVTISSPHYLLYGGLLLLSQIATGLYYPGLDLSDYLWSFGYFIIGFISYFVFPVVIARNMFKRWLIVLMAVGLFSAFIAVFVAFTGVTSFLGLRIKHVNYLSSLGFFYTGSIFFEANRFALVVFYSCMGIFYFLSQGKYKWIFRFLLLLASFGIIISWSRAVYVALFFAGFVWLIMKTKSADRPVVFLTSSVILFVFFSIIFSFGPIYSLVFGQQLANRDLWWPAIVKAVSLRPLWGYGIGNAKIVYDVMFNYAGYPTSVHSTPLGLAFRAGIPVFLLWLTVY